MIALLRGTVAAANPGEVVVDVGGVGYRVAVPPGTRIGALGAPITLHTHLAVREDALDLYGFPDSAAKALFTALLAVNGVGPKLALAALGALGSDGLRAAVIGEDVDALTIIPGVGRKGAARIVLELRTKLSALPVDGIPGGPLGNGAGPGGSPPDARVEVRQALAALGYGADEVQHALRALPDDEAASPEELLRLALRGLARSPATAAQNGRRR